MKTTSFLFIPALIFLMLSSISVVPSVRAAPIEAASGPKMQIKAGFDSYYKLNSWLPVQVNLSLPAGSSNFEGWLEASFTNFDGQSTIYRRAVALLSAANRQDWFYLPTGNHSMPEVQVRLTNLDGTVRETQAIPIRTLDQSELVIGVISDNPGALADLNNLRITQAYNKGSLFYATNFYSRLPAPGIVPSIWVIHFSLADLPPQASGWDSLDGLVLTNLSSFNPVDQTQNQVSFESAAATWLAQGRFLFFAGDSSLHQSGFLGDFLPVKPGGVPQNKALPDQMRPFLAGTTIPAQLLVADTSLLSGASAQLQLDGKPFLAEKPFGLGRSWFSAADLATLPGAVLLTIWKIAFQDYEPHTSYLTGLRQPSELSPLLNNQLTPNTKIAALPDVSLIAVFLGIYLLLLGLVGFLVLTKLSKPEIGWLAVPTLALGLTTGCYIVGTVTGGEPLVISRLSLIILGETAQGNMVGGATSLATLYSHSRLNLDLNVTDQTQALGLNPYRNLANQSNSSKLVPDFATLRQGRGGGFGKVFMGLDEQRSFAMESITPPEVREGIVAKLSSQGNELVGTLENRSKTDWADLSIWKSGNVVYKIPIIKAGEKLALQKSYAINNTTDSLVLLLAGLVNGKSGTSNSVLSFGPQAPQPQEVAVLSTLIGNEGQVLPRGANRVYLIGWKRATLDFPLQIGNQAASTNDLTLLFEPLTLS